MTRPVRHRRLGVDRLLAAVDECALEQRPPRHDWHDAIAEAVGALRRAIVDARHSDDAARFAGLASDLAAIWFDVDETDAIYLDEPMPERRPTPVPDHEHRPAGS